MGPLQGEVLEDEHPQLIASRVEILFRHVGMYPNGVHIGLAHQLSVRPQPIHRAPGRVDVRRQVVYPPQKLTLAVEIDLPVAQLYGAHTETHPFLMPVTDEEQLVQRLLPPIPGPPQPRMRQEKPYLKLGTPGLDPHIFSEFDSRGFEAQRTYRAHETRLCFPPGI